MDMIDLFPFLTGNETYEAALRKYIAALLAQQAETWQLFCRNTITRSQDPS